MKRALRWAVLALAVIVAAAAGGLAAVYFFSQGRLERTFEVAGHDLELPTDETSLEYGRHLWETRGCTDCHAEDLGGMTFIDEAPVARLSGSNLTSGEGGVAGEYRTARDWERAIRHAVGPDGSPLYFMPSVEYAALGDRDVAALIAFIRSSSPVDRVLPPQSVRPLGRALFLAGQVPLVHAELLDHESVHPPAPEAGPTVEYGRYLANGCIGCHAVDFSGGRIPGGPPEWPPAANITPSSDGIGSWSEADFMRAMREGVRPDGSAIDPTMPWQNTARMTEDELRALWLYLGTVPEVATE